MLIAAGVFLQELMERVWVNCDYLLNWSGNFEVNLPLNFVDRSELISKMNELEQQLASELKQSAILIEQWKYTKLEFEEKLSKSQTEHQTLEAKLAGEWSVVYRKCTCNMYIHVYGYTVHHF